MKHVYGLLLFILGLVGLVAAFFCPAVTDEAAMWLGTLSVFGVCIAINIAIPSKDKNGLQQNQDSP